MSGAGISTSAGIPDFRSPKTGLYSNLAALNLPHAEAVFEISFFRENPLPFYTLAQELYPGKFRPTITHSFIRLLEEKGLLLKHFTQNIDCLDREAGVSGSNIIEAHGSFARQSCIECKAAFPKEDMLIHVENKIVPRCLQNDCDGLVKPEIVFFGESLPQEFLSNMMLPQQADLVIVMGTSLTVAPFSRLPGMVPEGIPRVLINLERVGSLGSRTDDVLLLGDCDDGVCKLADACGWLDELIELWESVGGEVSDSHPARNAQGLRENHSKSKDEVVVDEINKLTSEIDKSLKISEAHEQDSRRIVKDLAGEGEPHEKRQRAANESPKSSAPSNLQSDETESASKVETPGVLSLDGPPTAVESTSDASAGAEGKASL